MPAYTADRVTSVRLRPVDQAALDRITRHRYPNGEAPIALVLRDLIALADPARDDALEAAAQAARDAQAR